MRLKSTKFRFLLVATLYIALSVVMADRAFSSSNEQFRAPDYDEIERVIFNSESDNFYSKIFDRYAQGDTTLNSDNYYYLYYGFSFSEMYRPLEINSMKDSLMVVMQRNQDDNFISPEIFGDMERIAKKSLSYNPFDLSVLNMLAFIYQMQGDEERAAEYRYKVEMIKEIIFSSGNGLTKKSPLYVISRSEQDAIIASMMLEYTKRSYVSIDVEVLHLKKSIAGSKGFYFDIGRIWTRMPEKKEEPKKRRFEFNPLQNPKSSRYQRPI